MYDIIGDIHGCSDELQKLLELLGYQSSDPYKSPYTHPEGRQTVYVGDLCDRGPNSPGVFAIARQQIRAKTGLCVIGNHDDKCMRWLKGNNVKVKGGLLKTVEQLETKKAAIKKKPLYQFLKSLPCRIDLDNHKLLICHAGLAEKYHLLPDSKTIRSKCLYGEPTGEKDEKGYPIRFPWQNEYHGDRFVVHGHVTVDEPLITNKVYNLDTGCVFGGKLTALRYPEMELVSVDANKVYWER